MKIKSYTFKKNSVLNKGGNGKNTSCNKDSKDQSKEYIKENNKENFKDQNKENNNSTHSSHATHNNFNKYHHSNINSSINFNKDVLSDVEKILKTPGLNLSLSKNDERGSMSIFEKIGGNLSNLHLIYQI